MLGPMPSGQYGWGGGSGALCSKACPVTTAGALKAPPAVLACRLRPGEVALGVAACGAAQLVSTTLVESIVRRLPRIWVLRGFCCSYIVLLRTACLLGDVLPGAGCGLGDTRSSNPVVSKVGECAKLM